MRLHVPVEVRNRYDGRWDEGFEVVEERPTGLRLRRLSDGAVLPAEFPQHEVRPADAQGTPAPDGRPGPVSRPEKLTQTALVGRVDLCPPWVPGMDLRRALPWIEEALRWLPQLKGLQHTATDRRTDAAVTRIAEGSRR